MNITLFDLINTKDFNYFKNYILETNQNLFVNDDFGNNLLHCACKKISENTLPLIQYLLEAGLDPLAVNEKFITPLEVAQMNNNFPAIALINYFIIKNKEY